LDEQVVPDEDMPLTDWELWACAQRIITERGAEAPLHVALRIAELAMAGDHEGVCTWQAIAERIDQLMDYQSGRVLHRHSAAAFVN
jgi:hypothetical protein